MGNVLFGAPQKLIEHLHKTFSIPAFIETGTFQGETSAWASRLFEEVVTIEGSSEFYHAARERYHNLTNIKFLQGDSRSELGNAIIHVGGESALFWLDAHWMPEAFGENAECPVIDEIRTIGVNSNHFILIDDARLFLAPPPKPHRPEDWPDILSILTTLATNGRYTIIKDDVIVSVPAFARAALREYCQNQLPPQRIPTLRESVSGFVRNLLHMAKK